MSPCDWRRITPHEAQGKGNPMRRSYCLLTISRYAALIVVAVFGTEKKASGQVTILGDTATGSGDLSAGLGTLTDPVRTLNVSGATTPIGGRSLLFSNTVDDVSATIDFSTFGLANDPTGFGSNDRLGLHITAEGGGADVNLMGDALVQSGVDESLAFTGGSTLLTDRIAGLSVEAAGPIDFVYTGDLTVEQGDLTLNDDFTAAVGGERFHALQIASLADVSTPEDIVINRSGDLTLRTSSLLAETTDGVGSNRARAIGNGLAANVAIGLFAIGAGDLDLTNTGDITVETGARTGRSFAGEGRAEVRVDTVDAFGIGLTRVAPRTGSFVGTSLDPRLFDQVTVRQNGDITVLMGDTTLEARSETAIGGSESEAYVEQTRIVFDRAAAIEIENVLDLDAEITGDISIDGGATNVTVDALAGADSSRGLVAAIVRAKTVNGVILRSRQASDFQSSSADVTLQGNVTAKGADLTADLSGSGIATFPGDDFPPNPPEDTARIGLGAGGGIGVIINQFTQIDPSDGSRLDDVDLSLDGVYKATGGDLSATVNGSGLEGSFSGGGASALGVSVPSRLTTTSTTRFEGTGGDATVTFNGTHGNQQVLGGGATGGDVRFQSFDDVTFQNDATATAGDATVNGDVGSDTFIAGGFASGLGISTTSPLRFTTMRATPTAAEQARIDARRTFVTGDIVATGGDATATDPDAGVYGGSATGVRRNDGTELVIQGDVTALGGSGSTADGVVRGVTTGEDFFPGAVPDLDTPFQTIRIEGTVTAQGEGVDAGDMTLRQGDISFGSLDLELTETVASGVSTFSIGNQQVVVGNGGAVQTDGEFVHGALLASEANTLVVENGGSINAQGANASGVEVRPYHSPSFTFDLGDGVTAATTATVTVEQGGIVSSQLGTGIKDDERVQAIDFTGTSITRTVNALPNDTNVIVGGTVTGGNGTAIDLGTGEDRVQLDSTAQVNGNVDLGAGNDRFAFSSGFTATGRIDGGDDEDVVEADIAAGMTETVDLSPLPLDNFEVVEKTGDGTLTLTGTPSGPFLLRVNDGLAQLGTDLSSLMVEVNSGGVFTNTNQVGDITTFGTGAFIGPFAAANVFNNGVTSPGGDGVIGTTNIAGDLMMGSTGILAIDIFADGSSDLVTVDGTATLDGTLAVNGVMFPMGFADDAEYVVLTSDNPVVGSFDSVVDNLPDVDAMVTILAATGPTDPDPNQPARVIVSYMRSDSGSDKAIFSNSAQYAGQMGLVFVETLQRRARLQGPCYGGEHGFWQEGVGASHRTSATGGVTGYRGGMGGYAAGVDRCVSGYDGTLRYGLAGAYTGGGLTSGASTAQIDGGQFGVYSSLNHTSGLLLSSALGYGFLDYDIERGIPVAGMSPLVASGNTLGGVLAFSIAGSFDLATHFDYPAGFRMAPIVRFDYLNARRSEYRESGAGMLDLTVGDTRYDSGLIGYGLEMGRTVWTSGGMRVNATYDIRYEQIVGRRNTFSQSTLAGLGGAPFVDQGVAEQRDRLAIGVGANVDVSKNVSIHGRYDTAMRTNVSCHRAAGGVTVRY